VLALDVLVAVHFVQGEVVENGAAVAVHVKYPQHLKSGHLGYLLCVARVRDRLALVVLEADVAQLAVGDVLHKDPPHMEHPSPALCLLPERQPARVVDSTLHRCHAAEGAACVHAEEEEDRCPVLLAEGAVKPLVAPVGARPHSKLDAGAHIVLAE